MYFFITRGLPTLFCRPCLHVPTVPYDAGGVHGIVAVEDLRPWEMPGNGFVVQWRWGTRRRIVYLQSDWSTRPRWLGIGFLELHVETYQFFVSNRWFEHPHMATLTDLQLQSCDRRTVMCAGMCGFRVNPDARYLGWCCVQCCIWTYRAPAGLDNDDRTMHTTLKYHPKKVSKKGPGKIKLPKTHNKN